MVCDDPNCNPPENINDPSITLNARFDNFALTGTAASPLICLGACPVDVLGEVISILSDVEQDFASLGFPDFAAKIAAAKDSVQRSKNALEDGKCKLAQNLLQTSINQVKALVKEVQAQSGKKISVSDVEQIISFLNQGLIFLHSLIPNLCTPCP